MNISKIKWVYVVSFIFSLHIAIPAYINSTFLTTVISEKYVGLIFTIASLLTIIFLTTSSKMLSYLGNRKFSLVLLLINLFGVTGLISSTNTTIILISFIIFTITNTLFFFCIDIFIEHFSRKEKVGKIRGFYLMIVNLAWMISPLITAGLISKNNNYTNVYLIAFFSVIIATIVLLFSVKKFKDKTYKKTPFIKTYRNLRNHKTIFYITTINFILQFFYALMVIYTPIYLYKHLGFSWAQIGIIFTIMLSPFIIISPVIGFLVDKYEVNKKTLLIIGILIISTATFSMSIIPITTILVAAIILFLTRVGASTIESTLDIYFFTHIEEEESSLLGVYRDMSPLSYIVAPTIGSAFIILFPFKYIFAILALIILSSLFYVFKLKKQHVQ